MFPSIKRLKNKMFNGTRYLTHYVSASVGSIVHTNEKEISVCCGKPCFRLLWVNLVSLGP